MHVSRSESLEGAQETTAKVTSWSRVTERLGIIQEMTIVARQQTGKKKLVREEKTRSLGPGHLHSHFSNMGKASRN
jgi:hypothetical protein